MVDSAKPNSAQNLRGARFLCFTLGKEKFALPLLQVKEVIANTETTPIPETPQYFKGIMNLRGQIISLIDLGCKLSMGVTEVYPETTIIIIDLKDHYMGILVDSVDFVLECEPGKISNPADHHQGLSSEFIAGVFNEKNKLILILDMEVLLGNEKILQQDFQVEKVS